MTLDLDRTLERIQARQWALADFDWDAPGAERITDEQRPSLTAFMADLVWIEHVGARAFAALARKAEDPTLATIYRYFHAEEQRHANVELALMNRWGMLPDGKLPPPNVNLRLVMAWVDGNADDLPMNVLSAAIPMLEVALDGALLKFLLDEVTDPLCAAVFERVNNDESRHLAVGFEVMDRLGSAPLYQHLTSLARTAIRPTTGMGILTGLPLLLRMVKNVGAMGLDTERLHEAALRYQQIGERGEGTRHNPVYQALRRLAPVLFDEAHPANTLGGALLIASDHVPTWLLPGTPAWAGNVTYEPIA